MDSLTFLGQKKPKILPLYIVHGDEDFLKRQVLHKLRQLVLGDEDDEFALSVYEGDKAEYAAVLDEVQTMPFFGSRRLVLVEKADGFVSKHRGLLEKAVDNLSETATLVMEVKSWPANTRLAKKIDSKATLVCKAPSANQVANWCGEWAKSGLEKQLTAAAARLLVSLVGTEMGQLAMELEKLAVYVGERTRIGEDDVDKMVGRSQAQTTWKIFDAIGQGNLQGALAILDQLLVQGEEPLRIVGAFSMQLRRLNQGQRLARLGKPLRTALADVGIPPFAINGCQQQIQHLGPERVARLYEELLQLNMDLRGDSPLSARILLERFVIRLARPQ